VGSNPTSPMTKMWKPKAEFHACPISLA